MTDIKLETIYQDYLKALLSGDRHNCQLIIEEMLQNNTDIRYIYVEIFQRSLYQIGEMWERNQISVAREHIATGITESLLPLLYKIIFTVPHNGRKAIVTCSANEYHQIGGKMVADILELNGWDSYFLGANTPIKDLLLLVNEHHPDLLCVSLSVYFALPGLLKLLDQIRCEFPSLPVFVGGQAFLWGGADRIKTYSGVQYVDSIAKIEKMMQQL